MGRMYRSLWQTCPFFPFVPISCHQWFSLLPSQQKGPTSSFSPKSLSALHCCCHHPFKWQSISCQLVSVYTKLRYSEVKKRKKRRKRLCTEKHMDLPSRLKGGTIQIPKSSWLKSKGEQNVFDSVYDIFQSKGSNGTQRSFYNLGPVLVSARQWAISFSLK